MTKSVILWVSFFFFAFVLQTTLVPSIAIMNVKPDLLLVVLFILAIKTGIVPAVYVGFLLGLGQDLYTPSILGQNALAKTIAGFVAGLFNEKVMRVDPLMEAVFVLIIFLINDTVFAIVSIVKFGGTFQMFGGNILSVTIPRALYSLLFAFIPILWEYYFKSTVKR